MVADVAAFRVLGQRCKLLMLRLASTISSGAVWGGHCSISWVFFSLVVEGVKSFVFLGYRVLVFQVVRRRGFWVL